MLKVNVGMSRKLSKDYNSTGFSLNLEGEICAALDDPEAVIERIREFYDLADEALRVQIDRYQSDSAIAGRDETPQPTNGQAPVPSIPVTATAGNAVPHHGNGHNGNGQTERPVGDAATNKQIQFLLNIGKRQGMAPKRLETEIEQILGRPVGIYDLTKRDAATVLDSLTQVAAGAR